MAPVATITYPGRMPSKGNFRRSGKNWRKRWQRIKDAQDEIGYKALKFKHLTQAYGEPRYVSATCVNQTADPGNLTKLIMDALEGILYANDATIEERAKPVKDPAKKPHVVIRIVW